MEAPVQKVTTVQFVPVLMIMQETNVNNMKTRVLRINTSTFFKKNGVDPISAKFQDSHTVTDSLMKSGLEFIQMQVMHWPHHMYHQDIVVQIIQSGSMETCHLTTQKLS
jgi:flavorubredoxin